MTPLRFPDQTLCAFLICAFVLNALLISIKDVGSVFNMYFMLMWNHYFQTLMMDQGRFTDLGKKFCHLVVTGSVLLVTTSTAQPLQAVAAFKNKLKEHINVLLEDSYTNK